MLTPQELLEVIDTMHPLLDGLNAWIASDLIKRIMARLGRGQELILTASDEWQLSVYQAAGGHLEAVQAEIVKFTKQSDAEVAAIFEGAGILAFNHDNDFYVAHGLPSQSIAQSEDMIQLLTDTYQRTNAEIHNFTRTTARASQKRLINILDTAHFKVMSGATSYTQAVKDAVNDIVTTQTKVYYPSGHEYTMGGVVSDTAIDGTLTNFSDKISNSFTALMDRLQAIADSTAFQIPAAATSMIPYKSAVADSTSRSTDEDGDISSVVIQAIANATAAIVAAIQEYAGADISLDGDKITESVISGINRKTRMNGKSPLLL